MALELEKIFGTDSAKEAFYKTDRNFQKIDEGIGNIDVSEDIQAHDTSETSHSDIREQINDLRTDVGDKTTLITTNKTNLVNAVNENRAQINDLEADYEKEATEFSIASDETYNQSSIYYKKNGWVKLIYRISRVDEGLIQRSEYLLSLPVGFRPKTSFVTVAVQCDVGITPPFEKMTLRVYNTGQLQAQENATKKIIHGEVVFYAGGGTI